MEYYDKDKVGELIAWKGDNFVYEYGEDEVIKFSKFFYLMGYEKSKIKSHRDYKICKRYFKNYLLETRIASSEDEKYIALIQPKISGRFLKLEDLKIDKVRNQVKEILVQHEELLRDGNADIDLIGQGGAFHDVFTNIFIMKDNNLVIFDAMLEDVKKFSFFEKPFFYLLFKLAIWRQNIDIKDFKKELGKYSS